jgi:DNA polymerase I-like protein with 3'-5' exonuclease and polymerase domains/uracil-DNA glycosylase
VSIHIPPHGVLPARVLVLGDFPSVEDEQRGKAFCGGAGEELRRMLQEAGFLTTELRFTYLCKVRPYASQAKHAWTVKKSEAKLVDNAHYSEGAWVSDDFMEGALATVKEIKECNPNVIISLGDAPLWWLTRQVSINKWRGSTLKSVGLDREYKVIPTYSPSQILRVWQWRAFSVRDMKRAFDHQNDPTVRDVEWRFKVTPDYYDVRYRLKYIRLQGDKAFAKGDQYRVSCDIETIARNIACIGFAWSKQDAICVPLMIHEGHWFTLNEECDIIEMIKEILHHRGIKVVGQNFNYDAQHIHRSWGFKPFLGFDTMLAQHVCFPGIPKDLGFLASMYVKDYVYWKDELDDYRSLPADLERFWTYNLKDCCHTYEISEVLEPMVARMGFQPQLDFLMRLNDHVFAMMRRGTRIDEAEKGRLALELMGDLEYRKQAIRDMVDFDLNINSPKQLQHLFYTEMKFRPIMERKTHKPTTNSDALDILAVREPLLKPLIHLINETRSIGVFLSTFVLMPLDFDKRMRCNFNVGGTETFRFSSSKNAFGTGGNLQNIPKGDEDEEHKEGDFVFPNLRRMFIPDRGCTLFDVDLAGADAQVVAWEAEDSDLKAKFRSGEKIHALNAKDLFGAQAGADGKRQPYYGRAKMGCHLTNYGGKPHTLSKGLGMTMREAEHFQRRWFQMHPGIAEWHERIEHEIMTTRSVRNKFGFRRFYFDRVENLLPEALAWIPQSTVAILINKGLCNIMESGSSMRILLQVHDSLVGQFPTTDLSVNLPILQKALQITVPYDDPLIIGTSLDLSVKSWGDLEPHNWV